VHVIKQFGVGVQIVPPSPDLAMQIGDAIDDRHLILTFALPGNETIGPLPAL
jgi:hypothetical protein